MRHTLENTQLSNKIITKSTTYTHQNNKRITTLNLKQNIHKPTHKKQTYKVTFQIAKYIYTHFRNSIHTNTHTLQKPQHKQT